MSIGERIKQLRQEANLTQDELADKLGLKKVSIQKYENGGIVNLKLETIENLAEILGVSPAYIMGWDKFDNIDTDEIKKDIRTLEAIRDYLGYVGVELTQILNDLNEEGRRKILFYAQDLLEIPRYKQNVK